MAKRVLLVAIIVAAILVVAAPAMAFNGYRSDYTVSTACQVCHDGIPGIPAVYGAWSETKHAESNADGQSGRLPYGSSCAGCHTANFDPSKVVPTPTATRQHRRGHLGGGQRAAVRRDHRRRRFVRGRRRLLIVPLQPGRRSQRHSGESEQPGQRGHLRSVSLAVLVHRGHLRRRARALRHASTVPEARSPTRSPRRFCSRSTRSASRRWATRPTAGPRRR